MSAPTNTDIFREIGRLSADIGNMQKEIIDLKADVKSLTADRNKGLGIIAAVTIIAGVIGAKAGAVLSAIFDVGGGK
jgi:ribulose kinase